MSNVYPSLEDMKVGETLKAQAAVAGQQQAAMQAAQSGLPAPAGPASTASGSSLYPSLNEYMGLELQPYMQEHQMYSQLQAPVAVRQTASGNMQVAPITGDDLGLARAEIKQGLRPVILCKDQNGKIGLRVRHVNKGLFVAFVHKGSVAAMAGLRFGDQILQLNDEAVAGWEAGKFHDKVKAARGDRITMAVRDRPFERTITLHKNSTGHIGFTFKDGCINAIAKDSSAARNGLLTDHQLIEVGGQNVVGLKDKEVGDIIRDVKSPVTITVMPLFIYNHIIKCMGDSLLTKLMDHSVPDL